MGVTRNNPHPGAVKTGTVVSYDPDTNTMQVKLSDDTAQTAGLNTVKVKAPTTLCHANGLFIGALPTKGTPVAVTQSTGGEYFFSGYRNENLKNIPNINPGTILIHSTNSSEISLDLSSNITIGSSANKIHVFSGSQNHPESNLITLNFVNENHFTQAYREVGGLVKRNVLLAATNGLDDDVSEQQFTVIGMDPMSTANNLKAGTSKNPPFVEHREIVYEFQYKSDIEDDKTESNKYLKTTASDPIYTSPNRRDIRDDIMSLTWKAPNLLIEEVKGTVIDIFGGILDINRMALPVGLDSKTTIRTSGTVANTDPQKAFLAIKALERKSIAYHFEINARKDPSALLLADINTDSSYAKMQRSKFALDIDKEGLFKLNVPASSETGNIPLLVRPENYSTFATTDNSNPNQLAPYVSPSGMGQDIFIDSFAAAHKVPSADEPGAVTVLPHGSIQLLDSSDTEQGPIDRITQFVDNNPLHIKHGTAHHDILQACFAQRDQALLSFPTGGADNIDPSYIYAGDPTTNPTMADVANSKIIVAGPKANAGGRSGSMNLDGSLEMNVGANTVDRQSLWVDTAGGAVIMLGRDLHNRSLMMGMDGHAFIQVGGPGISDDPRFVGQSAGLIDGILDIRVFSSGAFNTLIRVDSQGILITTPGRIGVHAGQGMTLTSDSDIKIDCESLTLQGRLVNKGEGAWAGGTI